MMEINAKDSMNMKAESMIKKSNITQYEFLVFQNAIKRGVYKELYKKQLLTSQQLNELLAQAK